MRVSLCVGEVSMGWGECWESGCVCWGSLSGCVEGVSMEVCVVAKLIGKPEGGS